jgi:hypothetical protein
LRRGVALANKLGTIVSATADWSSYSVTKNADGSITATMCGSAQRQLSDGSIDVDDPVQGCDTVTFPSANATAVNGKSYGDSLLAKWKAKRGI